MAKNTKKTVRKIDASKLFTVASASYDSAHAVEALVKAVRAAGAKQQEVRDNYIAGQIALKMGVNAFNEDTRLRALAVVTMPAHSEKNPAKEGSRTKQQELWFVAAKVKWSRFLKDNGFESTGKNAGNKSAKGAVRTTKGHIAGSSPSAAGDEAPKLIPGGGNKIPEPKMDRAGAVSHVQLQSASLLQFSNKHAKLLPATFKTAIAAFKLAIDKATNEEQGAGPAL